MNYDEITKITAERISDYMTEAVNTDSIAVAEMFHNAAWGVRTLWFELVTKIDIDIHKKNRYASYDLRRKIEMQHEEFQKMTEESMKNPGAVVMLPSRITSLYSERLSYNRGTNWRICPVVRHSGLQFRSVTNNATLEPQSLVFS